MLNSYGMTEGGHATFTMDPEGARTRPGAVGRPTPPVEVRIVDDDGGTCAVGAVGEVLTRNPDGHREYYKDPEATARLWEGGWLHTGDLGYLDADGYLYIVGRKKEMIVRGGMNIYADDVEAALHAHPAVVEAAVVGVPHEVLGEDVAAYVVLRPGSGRHHRRADGLRRRATGRLQGAPPGPPWWPSCRGTPAARWSSPGWLAARRRRRSPEPRTTGPGRPAARTAQRPDAVDRTHERTETRTCRIHNFDFVVEGTPEEVWDVIWKRTRVGVETDTVKIEIYHPGDEEGNGLVRHCHFPVPKYLLSKGRAQSWEWITEAKRPVSWRYDAVGKPLWSRASGLTRLEDLGRRADPGLLPRDLRGVQPGHAGPVREAGPPLHLQGQRQAHRGLDRPLAQAAAREARGTTPEAPTGRGA